MFFFPQHKQGSRDADVSGAMGLSSALLSAAGIEFPAEGGATEFFPRGRVSQRRSSRWPGHTLRTPPELSEKTSRATRGQVGEGNDNISSADTESGVEMERLWRENEVGF